MKNTILSIVPDSFDTEVLLEARPVLVACISRDYDYVAQTGVLCSIAKIYGEKIKACLLKEDSIRTFRKLGIDGSPAFMVFHKGKEKGRMLGKADKLTLNSFIKKSLPGLEGGMDMTKVLIVDDEEAIRFVFHRFLTAAGYEVSLAEHEIDARKILSSDEFDVAVVDRILPGGMSGMDLREEIKRLQPDCEVIMISGLPMFESADEIADEQDLTYLTKPVKKDEIIQAVREAAEKSKTKKLGETGI